MRVLAPLPAGFDADVHDVRQYRAITDDTLPGNTGVLLFHAANVDGELVGIEDAPDDGEAAGRYDTPVVLCVATLVGGDPDLTPWRAAVAALAPVVPTPPAEPDAATVADASALVDALSDEAREALRRLLARS